MEKIKCIWFCCFKKYLNSSFDQEEKYTLQKFTSLNTLRVGINFSSNKFFFSIADVKVCFYLFKSKGRVAF
jgi:hypothetical protein